ncbi:MAG: phosphotransferase [Bacteroidetes bacterium]|nr:phosphotransferase [Candidatus Colenecus caballi]
MENFNSTTLEDWIPFGDGATSTCYYHRENPDLMLKFFDQGRTGSDYADREFSLSSAVWAMSVSTPRAIQVVSIEDKKAIIYERITPKISVSRLCTDNPDKFDEYVRQFSLECRKLHATPCTQDLIKSRKQQVIDALNSDRGLSEKSRQFLLDLAGSVEDSHTCLHGDMQSGNLVFNGKRYYWIDLGAFAWGNPMFDVGGMYFFYKSRLGQILYGRIFHMKKSQLSHFWDVFTSTYPQMSKSDFDKEARKWSLLFIVYTLAVESFSKFETWIVNLYINRCIRKL